MWIIHRNAVSDEQQDTIQKLENRFRPGGTGNSGIVDMDLYPNRWDLVNHYQWFRRVVI